ncbi:phage tail tape measure protein, partial [Salmonella enterica]
AGGKLTPVYYDMARQIKQLGAELPIPVTQIAEMVTAGARMEVPRQELIDYTRTVAMMATAFDAVPDEIAESMGKVAKNFRIPTNA